MNKNLGENYFWHRFGLSKTMVCWTWFPTFVTLSFVTEELTFSKFRIPNQKYYETQRKWTTILGKSKWPSPFSLGFMFFLIGIPELQKVGFSVTKLNVKKVGNRVQQTMVLDSPKWCQKWFPAKFWFVFIGFINDFRQRIPEIENGTW